LSGKGGGLPERAWAQAEQRVSEGGEGFTPPHLIIHAAFLGGMCYALNRSALFFPVLARKGVFKLDTPSPTAAAMEEAFGWVRDLIDRTRANASIIEADTVNYDQLPLSVEALREKVPKGLQHTLTSVHAAVSREGLFDDLSLRARARLMSSSVPEARLPFICTPSSFNLRANNTQVVIAHRQKLDLPLPRNFVGSMVCMACGEPVEADGMHFRLCSYWGVNQKVHDAVRDILIAMHRAAGFHVQGEPRHILRRLPDGTLKWPDFLVRNYQNGRDLVADVTITNPDQVATAANAAFHPKFALQKAATSKVQEYRALCVQHDVDFMPCAFESFGAFGDEVHATIAYCYARVREGAAGEVAQSEHKGFVNFWETKIAMALSKGMAEKVITLSGGRFRV
jgi:hypothetical protein